MSDDFSNDQDFAKITGGLDNVEYGNCLRLDCLYISITLGTIIILNYIYIIII